jgi:hypothetical protein
MILRRIMSNTFPTPDPNSNPNLCLILAALLILRSYPDNKILDPIRPESTLKFNLEKRLGLGLGLGLGLTWDFNLE